MTYKFLPFSTVFKSYQDDWRMIMKDYAMESHLRLNRFLLSAEIEP